ncbi:MAG TPA: hypothetical protein RMH99_27295 [Sandaracinaceae bacterium LLY-WYZ-13_1]|nr:hypothetical protein [Sandaracinaceae bacterium LLY-WYZ-13_1]
MRADRSFSSRPGAAFAAAIAGACALGAWAAAPERGRAQARSLHPIELCWFATGDRDSYVINNDEINEHVADPLTHDEARLTHTEAEELMLFCPMFDDDILLDHDTAESVRLQGFAAGDWEIEGSACVDQHFGISTSCTDAISDSGGAGTIDFQMSTDDGPDRGWRDPSGTEDRAHWYAYLVYTLRPLEEEADTIFLTGYRIEES